MYAATVVLLRSEKQFWRMTPRKLSALVRAHADVNAVDEEDKENSSNGKAGYIDQIF